MATRSITASCAARAGAAGCTTARTARRRLRLRRGEPAGSGRSPSRDAALLAPILGHLMTGSCPRGAFALWLPGTADRAVVAALRAGLRLDQFPILLCWDRPFADFTRYLPISPGLL